MISVFISYAREDFDRAAELYKIIKAHGFTPWLDKMQLVGGQNWKLELNRAVKNSDVQVFVCSPRSVGKRGFVQLEIKEALTAAKLLLSSDISIIPYLLEPCEVPAELSEYQWIEDWSETATQDLIKALGVAAMQRGIFEHEKESAPVVLEYIENERDEGSRYFWSKYRMPVVSFPQNRLLSEEINAVVRGGITQSVSNFRRSAIDDRFAAERDFANFYEADVKAVCLTQRVYCVVSLAFYHSGGVHPNSHREALIVDISEQSLVRGSQLFRKNDFFVRALTLKMRDIPGALIEESEVPKIVSDTLDGALTIEPDKVRLLFDPYQVFPYVIGPFDLSASYQEIASDLSDFGREFLSDMLR